MDLMLSANRAKMLHVTDDYNELGRLLEVATARGRAMGLTTQQAFNDLVTGIGRISPPILDNLGILTGGEATFKAYAESIGKAGQELSDIEKRQALVNKVLEESVAVTQDAAGANESLQVAKANLRMEIGLLVSDFIAETGAVENLTAKMTALREAMEFERKASEAAKEMSAAFTANLEQQISAAGMNEQLYQRMAAGQRALEVAFRDGRITAEQYQAGIDKLEDELRAATGQMSRAEIEAANLAEATTRSMAAAYSAAKAYDAAGTAAYRMGYNFSRAAALQLGEGEVSTATGYVSGMLGFGGEALEGRLAELRAENKARVDAYKDDLSAQKSYASASTNIAEQQFDALRGIVESALSPTAVTAADLAATAAGTYVDKWDEYMRRIRMPESGMGADQIAEQERLFYSGQMMDQVNWEAVVSDVQRKVQEQAGREALVQEAMRQVQMAGIGASQSQVAGALGITDFAAMGQEQQQALSAGFKADGLAVTFTDQFETELGEQQERWVTMGKMSVEWMAEGIDRGATPEVTHRLINLLVPRVAEALTGGTRP
jgi:hypothetical protein